MLWGALLLAVSLSIVHFFSDIFSKLFDKFHIPIVNFSSGFFISLIFLELMPQAMRGMEYFDVFFAIFAGFVAFHLAEKYVYQHVKNKHEMIKDLKIFHEVGFFIEHFLIGFFLVLVFRIQGVYSMVVFVPLALHTISSSLTMESIHLMSKSYLNKIILSISTIVGALVAGLIAPFGFAYYSFFSIALGALFYVGVRDMLPLKKGNPIFFVTGVVINIVLFSAAKIL
ncbi:MAG: hypothetical protein ABIB71_07440 [Candidatus Woesearchaeota archaeon]